MGKQQHFEFFGPHGPALLMCVLPSVLLGLVYTCNASGCLQLYPKLSIPGFAPGTRIFTTEGLLAFTGWFFTVVALHLLLPGRKAQGVVLPNGQRLTYKLNSFTVLLITYGAAIYFGFFTPYLNLGWLYDNYVPLLTGSIIFSATLTIYLYVSSFKRGALLSSHGCSGYPWYDMWMGRELNPRVGGLDLKEFCELYPGLIGWALLNLAMAHKQWTSIGHVTNSMVLTNAFQLYYVVDALWNEQAILTTMDITTDGFGYMLAFGDLTWVPFVFSNAARFLADHPQELSWRGVALVLGVKLLGYWIFRGANSQKDTFRRDPSHPSVKGLKTVKTERGTQLICSSWWGTARHINYFGDWIMGVAWCMPTGLAGVRAVVPYFYCIYFASLLIHRERRDEANCRAKYGKDWAKYCGIVRWRIVPYVY